VPEAAGVGAPPVERSGVLKRVEEMLGVGGLRSDQDLTARVEARLPTTVIDSLRRAGLTDQEVFALVLPRRTLTHRRARREALTPEESDRAVRIARAVALAERVFDDRDRAWRWLRAGKRQFRGRTPVQMLATETGARLVEDLLWRIDDGMAA
jgi:putative toxin-antitoxin system antitoxin component (TIGR02293 family)